MCEVPRSCFPSTSVDPSRHRTSRHDTPRQTTSRAQASLGHRPCGGSSPVSSIRSTGRLLTPLFFPPSVSSFLLPRSRRSPHAGFRTDELTARYSAHSSRPLTEPRQLPSLSATVCTHTSCAHTHPEPKTRSVSFLDIKKHFERSHSFT